MKKLCCLLIFCVLCLLALAGCAHTHAYTPSTPTVATCTEASIVRYTCTCGHYYDSEVSPALGHEMTKTEGIAVTCDSDGRPEYNSNGQPVSLKLDKTQVGKLTSGFLFNSVLQELGDARSAADAYKEWCADASLHTITIKGETYTAELTPKFDDFKDDPNYYKLLEDFNCYDCITEEAAPQGDVQQIYPDGFEKILRDELSSQERYRQKQEKNQAFDKAMERLGPDATVLAMPYGGSTLPRIG